MWNLICGCAIVRMCGWLILVIGSIAAGCAQPEKTPDDDSLYTASSLSSTDSFPAFSDSAKLDSIEILAAAKPGEINTGNVQPQTLVEYAQTLKGIPYKYASTDPAKGFDCSGFINHVFNHFGIKVPRSSVDFTHVGKEIPTSNARGGDLILFTGTDSTIKVVGHMGIVTTADGQGELEFIHSTSGKAYGVTTTPLNGYYRTRFVKVIRVFPD